MDVIYVVLIHKIVTVSMIRRFKVRKELEFQIAESNKLIDYKVTLIESLKTELSQESTTLTELLRELELIKKPQIKINIEIRRIISKIGALKSQIKSFK